MDVQGISHGLIWGTVPELSWREWRETRKSTFSIVGVPVNIRNRQLPDTSQKGYRFCRLTRYLGIGRRVKLKHIFKNQSVKIWTGFNWLSIGSTVGLLWTNAMNYRVTYMLGDSWLVTLLSAALWSYVRVGMGLIRTLQFQLPTFLLTLPYNFMKSTIFWDMTPCIPLSFSRRFGGTYHLLANLPPACSLVCWTYFFDPEDGGDMFLRNVG
jgi:hypothetical protein